LWFRLNVFPIVIPPLRHRTEDIPAMVYHFIERKSKELKIRDLPSIAPAVLDKLQTYIWPGNVRELENLIERELILNQKNGNMDLLRFDAFTSITIPKKRESDKNRDADIQHLDDMISAHIEKALELSNGRIEGKNGAAEMLGLHPSTLRGRMRKLNIPHGRMRSNQISRT
ncbi:MAG: Fis family transcriptional regulator, partial [Deltaproteobacteria bacterium]|nr:Fis family transcriptional regulator [Deltaproteobacteria bacterium]